MYATVNGVGMLPPTQIVCVANGCVEMVGSGFTITVATFEVTLEQPPELKLITQ